jgi:hypothetical protein
MAFTIPSKTAGTALLLMLAGQSPAASPGLPTRDQNPLLQAFYLPSINMQFEDGFHLSHGLFITNTFQDESRGSEQLVIDVENYRYDLSLAYQQRDWRLSSTLPFITNDSGSLDGLIEDWHDFFGLPEGERPANPDNRIKLSYIRNGETIVDQSSPDSDIGDLSLSIQYLVRKTRHAAIELGFGIELPTGSIESNSSNEKIDTAFWLSGVSQLTQQSRFYGLLGISFPGKGGQLKELVKDRIWLSQLGTEYDFNENISAILQFDLHTATLENTQLRAFGNSLQMQIALQFRNWIPNHAIDLFFSEDILIESAPDITFGLRVSRVAF